MQSIEITIRGGAVQDAVFPRGIRVLIRDYDIDQGWEGPDLRRDEQGALFQELEFVHDENRAIMAQAGREKPPRPVALSSRLFKLWVSIEAIQDERDCYADLAGLGLIEPVSLGAFESLSQAIQWLLNLPGCLKDERDQAVLARANQIERELWGQLSASSRKMPGTDQPGLVPADRSNVDWKLLRRQKESLLRAIRIVGAPISRACQGDLTGILHLLDSIQDQAAARLGEAAVFGRHRGGSTRA